MQKIADKSKDIFGSKLDSVILFGSYTGGDFDEESDIEIYNRYADVLPFYKNVIKAIMLINTPTDDSVGVSLSKKSSNKLYNRF